LTKGNPANQDRKDYFGSPAVTLHNV